MANTIIYPFGQGSPIGGPSYVVSWDGDSVPVVGQIPAGITVTYNGTTYTGTLAAGTSTKGKMFLVAQSNNTDVKDIYVTADGGNGTYVWTKIGTTEIVLTGYATETWVEARDVDLTVAEYDALVDSGMVDPNKRYFVDEAL